MNLTTENILFIGSVLLIISIVVGKTSYKFGVPTLILFLTIGMLAGSDGIGGIHFDNPRVAQFIGIVCLNFILFSGGLVTKWSSVRPIVKQAITLSTLGVFLTTLFLGFFVWVVTDFTIYESMLLGAIVSSTDAAAVFSILRSKNIALKHNLRPILEFESGSNDPMAYILTIMFLSLVVNQDQSVWSLIPLFFQQMIVGAIAGLVFGKLTKYIINNIKLDFEGLYPVLVIALMFFTFSATDFMNGNGFLAIYICAVYLGNQDLIHKNTILQMYDGLAWLVQIILFLTLGLLVFPSDIIPYIFIGILISLFLIVVARPLSVFISLIFFKINLNSKLYISWVGLRGAVPIVFATYPLLANIEKAHIIFNIVFFISLTSVILQGTTLSIVAKWLKVSKLDQTPSISGVNNLNLDLTKSHLKEIKVLPEFCAVNKRIVDLKLPDATFIALIKRDDKYIRPGGSTKIESNDVLTIIADNEKDFHDIDSCLQNSN